MKLFSHAQNHEDVILWRALRNVASGIYVDVGAQDPVADSVTKLFHEHGWRGINIEPVAYWYQRLCEDRPDDVNLQVIVGSSEGKAVVHEVVRTGLSTTDAGFADRHRAAGHEVVDREVEQVTLDAILQRHPLPEIHFLKIDVEGAEKEVLAGLDLGRWRPWIILVEAYEPNSSVECFHEWEPGVLAAGYDFVYEDGLNRFYLARERAELASAFRLPPNITDGFDLQAFPWADRLAHYAELLENTQQLADARATELAGQTTRLEQVQAEVVRHADLLEKTQQLADARASELESVRSVLAGEATRLERVQAEVVRHADLLEKTQQLADARASEVESMRSALAGHAARLEHTHAELVRHADLLDKANTALVSRVAELADAARKLDFLEEQLESVRQKASEGQLQIGLLRAENALLAGTIDERDALLAQILKSHSWRITRPLRVLRRLFSHGPGELAAAFARLRTGAVGQAGGTARNEEGGATDTIEQQDAGASTHALSPRASHFLQSLDDERNRLDERKNDG